MSMRPDTNSSNPPLGAARDLRRRLLFHHLPLAVASVTVLVSGLPVRIFQTAGHHGPSQGMQHEVQADGHQGLDHLGGPHGAGTGVGGTTVAHRKQPAVSRWMQWDAPPRIVARLKTNRP